jgi:vanillate O-demethylase monooxygenase subunit
VAYADQVTDKPFATQLLDEALVVYRTTTGVMAAKDMCLHRGAKLSLGWVEGDEIVCGYHGFRYNPEGQCTKIPANPNIPISSKLCLATCPALERYGLIWVCLAGEPVADLPDWKEIGTTFPHVQHLETLVWKASAARAVENFSDIAHFSWLHMKTFGNRDKPEVSKYTVERTERGLRMDYTYPAVDHYFSTGTEKAERDIHFIYDLTFPYTSRLGTGFHDDGRMKSALYHVPSPWSAKETHVYFILAQEEDLGDFKEPLLGFERTIMDEDRNMVESQRPEELPLDLSEEFHIPADQYSTAFRKGLAALGLGHPHSA